MPGPTPAILDSDSPETTHSWARNLGASLRVPLVVALTGNLGAGKTLVAKGIAAGLGVTAPVTSPTFTLINEYSFPGGILFHIDCYRLEKPVDDAKGLGLEELFDQGIVLIEWADRIRPLLPDLRLDIDVTDAGPGRRLITLSDWR